jgi:superoxide dismutase, Cu-Zn family
MKIKNYILGILACLLCNIAYADDNHVRAKLYDQTGKFVGKVSFTQRKKSVLVVAEVKGLLAGFHGFHIHSIGECIAPFTSAGPHFEQGIDSNHRDHNGDMPVLLVNNNGTAQAVFKTDRFAVADLFDKDRGGNGRAVIIHANPDNYANIPTSRYSPAPDATTLATGDAGNRLVCGIIEKKR